MILCRPIRVATDLNHLHPRYSHHQSHLHHQIDWYRVKYPSQHRPHSETARSEMRHTSLVPQVSRCMSERLLWCPLSAHTLLMLLHMKRMLIDISFVLHGVTVWRWFWHRRDTTTGAPHFAEEILLLEQRCHDSTLGHYKHIDNINAGQTPLDECGPAKRVKRAS